MQVGTTVGVDVGGTKVLARVCDPARPDVALIEVRRPTPLGVDALVCVIDEVVHEAVELAEGSGRLASVGIGVPGLVDGTGTLRFAPHLPGVTDLELRDLLERRMEVPVGVANDATLTGLAEARAGAGRGYGEVVVVAFGTGIGGGVVSNGAIVGGAHGFAAEPGHMLVDPAGPPCACGQRGCWETYASGTGLATLARRAVEDGRAAAVLELAGGDPATVKGEHVATAARAGDPDALGIVDDLGRWIAVGLANLITLLDPDVVVLAGGLLAMFDLLEEPVRRELDGRVFASAHRPDTPVVAASLGPSAGAVGAWMLGRDLLATSFGGATAGE